ncbi:MAG: glycosyltransferase family 39 protein [Bryobacteraceae bacterium]|jgi:hypothetical protein
MEWLRKHPVAAFLPLQALLCFWNLGLLSPWGDEAITLLVVRLPVREILRVASGDVHPPLYYLLVNAWMRLPLGLDGAVQARALSVLFALAATVAADRLWASRLAERGRIWFLALWTLSPCLLLYARMCRSYSLQLLVATVAGAYILRFAAKRSWKTGAGLATSLTAGLYTHYVPGLAMLATANLALLRKRRFRDAIGMDTLLALAYLPWMGRLAASLGSWGTHTGTYMVTGAMLSEIPVKLAFWAMSFAMGEAVPDMVLMLGSVVLLLAGTLALSGARRERELVWIAAPAASIGFVGVARWVSYPFIPARMLFVFPFLLLLFVAGATAHRRAGALAVIAMLALSVSGVWCYFHKTGFRNKQYPLPIREIASYIRQSSTAADSAILVDSINSDPNAMEYALGPSRPFLKTDDPAAALAVARLLADRKVRTIWFLRNTHDLSEAQLDERFEKQLGAAMAVTIHPYEAFTPLEIWLMRAMRIRGRAAWFHELLEFRR